MAVNGNISFAFTDSNTSNVADFSSVATNISEPNGDLNTSNVRILPAGGTYPDNAITGTISHSNVDFGGGSYYEVYEVNPTSSLAEGTVYTVALIGGETGITANNTADWMTANAPFSFTNYSTPPPDETPPTITSVSPSNGTVYVTGDSIIVNFDGAMNPATFSNMTVTNLSTNTTAEGSWGASNGNMTATFPLSVSIQYLRRPRFFQ